MLGSMVLCFMVKLSNSLKFWNETKKLDAVAAWFLICCFEPKGALITLLMNPLEEIQE